jgi:septal ring-binding cell division protein DamX
MAAPAASKPAPAPAAARPAEKPAVTPGPAERPAAVAAGTAAPASQNQASPPAPAGKLTRARFDATQELLKKAPGDAYSIQLVTANTADLHAIEELLARSAVSGLAPSDFYVYGVKIGEQQHYRLAYGLFPTFNDANQAMRHLPSAYTQFRPFLRSVGRMRSQNRQ